MIELKNLQKVIDQKTVLDIETLTVQSGEIAALVGPAGSGKSTLLNILTGRSRPTVGMVLLNGHDPLTDRDRFSQGVGVLFFEDGLYQHRSPLANMRFHARLYGLPRSRAGEVLELVGLADHAKAKMEKLTSGLSRRLAFGRAIIHEPRVLLLAEPFARCDEASIGVLSRLMRQSAGVGFDYPYAPGAAGTDDGGMFARHHFSHLSMAAFGGHVESREDLFLKPFASGSTTHERGNDGGFHRCAPDFGGLAGKADGSPEALLDFPGGFRAARGF